MRSNGRKVGLLIFLSELKVKVLALLYGNNKGHKTSTHIHTHAHRHLKNWHFSHLKCFDLSLVQFAFVISKFERRTTMSCRNRTVLQVSNTGLPFAILENVVQGDGRLWLLPDPQEWGDCTICSCYDAYGS